MADLYVSPTGLDTNTGFSSDQPLRTPQQAIDVAMQRGRQTSVEVAAGQYDNGITVGPGALPLIISGTKK